MASSQNENAVADDWQTGNSSVRTALTERQESINCCAVLNEYEKTSRKIGRTLLLIKYYKEVQLDISNCGPQTLQVIENAKHLPDNGT